MSWLPSFLTWPTAAIAAAIAVPALLLLYFLKLRRREMSVSSTLLWKKTIQDLQVNAPFQRLRRNLLLILQMAILVAILLAMARPAVNANVSAGKLSVILIDRSASMSATDVEGRSRLDEAKRQARELIATMDKDASAMVIAFSDDRDARTIQSFTSDKVRLRAAIDSVEPSDRLTRLGEAYRVAEAPFVSIDPEQLRPAGDQARAPDAWLFSDGRALDAGRLGLRVARLKYWRIGSDAAANIAIVALSAKRSYARPTEVQVFARFANFGPEPAEGVGVLLWVDGQVQRVDQKLVLLPERWSVEQRQKWERQTGRQARAGVDFAFELLTSAVIRVEHASKEGDMLRADDAAQIVVPPPKALAALIVTEGNYYLQRAIDSMELKNVRIVKPAEYAQLVADPAKIGQYDVIVFDRHSPKDLPPVGNFVYFGCVPPGTVLKAAEDSGGRVLLKDVGVLDWQRDHALVRNINLQRLYVAEMLKLELPSQLAMNPAMRTQTIVEGTLGPLVVLHREGRSAHLVVSFSILESNWPLRQSFPVFIHNTMVYMALGGDMDLRQSLPPGTTPVLPRLSLQQAGIAEQLRLVGPQGHEAAVRVPDTGDVAIGPLDAVGLYTTDPPVPGFEKMAVNLLDENESNLLPAERGPGAAADGATAIAGTGGQTRVELWWWILAGVAVPLCLVEWWVYTRRVHL
jgi:hypothetical protein